MHWPSMPISLCWSAAETYAFTFKRNKEHQSQIKNILRHSVVIAVSLGGRGKVRHRAISCRGDLIKTSNFVKLFGIFCKKKKDLCADFIYGQLDFVFFHN